MSQNHLQVQRLEALLRRKKKETRELQDELDRARSSVSAAVPYLDPLQGDYQVSSSHPTLNENGRSKSNTVPRSTMAAGMVSDLGPRPGLVQQLVRLPSQRSPFRAAPLMLFTYRARSKAVL
jgi:hypothetical protein